VDRVNRIGQKKKVRVYQLIAENTVESKVLDIQQRKKEMIQQVWIKFLCTCSLIDVVPGLLWNNDPARKPSSKA